MYYKGQGENKEYCERVIRDILSQWDKTVCGKTTNQEGEGEDEVN